MTRSNIREKINALIFLSFSGTIFPPPGGTELTFLPETDAKIQWSFDDTPDRSSFRAWYFKHSDSGPNTPLARIVGDGTAAEDVLPGFAIEGGAILVIKNVNESRNGKYQFSFPPNPPSEVVVSVISKFLSVV